MNKLQQQKHHKKGIVDHHSSRLSKRAVWNATRRNAASHPGCTQASTPNPCDIPPLPSAAFKCGVKRCSCLALWGSSSCCFNFVLFGAMLGTKFDVLGSASGRGRFLRG
eukprot:1279452-Amphidinium_carterae.1